MDRIQPSPEAQVLLSILISILQIKIESLSPNKKRPSGQKDGDISDFADLSLKHYFKKKVRSLREQTLQKESISSAHNSSKNLEQFKTYVSKIMNARTYYFALHYHLAPQFVGMERINFDENKKLGWGFFSNHLFNKLIQNEYANDRDQKEGYSPKSILIKNSKADALSPINIINLQLIQSSSQQRPQVKPVTGIEEFRTFKNQMNQRLNNYYHTTKAAQYGQVMQQPPEGLSFSYLARLNVASLDNFQSFPDSQFEENNVVDTGSFKLHTSFSISPQKIPTLDKKESIYSQQYPPVVQKSWRYQSLSSKDETDVMRVNRDIEIDSSDPLNLGKDAQFLLQSERPLFLYVRRRSCCCQGCKLSKDHKGMKIVIEEDLIGKRLIYKQILVKASQVLRKKSDKHKSHYANQFNQSFQSLVYKKFQTTIFQPKAIQQFQKTFEKQSQNLLVVENKKTRISNLRNIVQNQISQSKQSHEKHISMMNEESSVSNGDGGEHSDLNEFDLDELLQDDTPKKQKEKEESKNESLLLSQQSLQHIDKKEHSPQVQKKVKPKFMNSIVENNKFRTPKAGLSSVDKIREGGSGATSSELLPSLAKQMSFKRQQSVIKRREQDEKLKIQTNKRIKQLFNTNLITERVKDIGRPLDISESTQGILTSRRNPSISINNQTKQRILSNIMKKIPGKAKEYQITNPKLLQTSRQSFLQKLQTQSGGNFSLVPIMTSRDSVFKQTLNFVPTTTRKIGRKVNEDLSLSSKREKSLTYNKSQVTINPNLNGSNKLPTIVNQSNINKKRIVYRCISVVNMKKQQTINKQLQL